MKLSYLLLPLCLVAATSQAADEMDAQLLVQPDTSANVEVVPYRYGMKLDIERVISIQEPDSLYPTCEIVTAIMVYEDSNEVRRALSYLKVASACSNVS